VDRKFAWRALFPLVLIVTSGCAGSPRFGGTEGLQVQQAGALPPPQPADLAAFERPYRVGPFDELIVEVFGIPELTAKEVQVDASGRMSFPLVGTVEVSGKTPGEVEETIEAMLRGKYIRNPQVTVNLKKTVSQLVTIGGEVKKPGLYPVIGRMTLMRAIATAEGMTELGRKKDIVVFRTVGGQNYAALYDLRAIEQGNYADPEIFASDVVMVGDSASRRLFKDLSPLIAPVIIYGLLQ
jgi:polysaccharide export outer membrane protein